MLLWFQMESIMLVVLVDGIRRLILCSMVIQGHRCWSFRRRASFAQFNGDLCNCCRSHEMSFTPLYLVSSIQHWLVFFESIWPKEHLALQCGVMPIQNEAHEWFALANTDFKMIWEESSHSANLLIMLKSFGLVLFKSAPYGSIAESELYLLDLGFLYKRNPVLCYTP